MSERFIRLYELQNNLYSTGSPVIVSAGALLKDTQTNNIIVQLKFHSVCVTPIKALQVGIAAFDIAGKEIEGVDEYQYLDLNIQNGYEFGSNKAIVMPDVVTRSISVRNITAVLANGNIQDVSMPMTALPKTTSLQSRLKDAELVKQYKLAVNDEAAYIPQETDNLWMCSCGEWNSDNFCTRCRTKKSTPFSAYNVSTLTEKMTVRLATEQAEREEQQRLAEIERQRKEEKDRIAVEEAAKRKAAEAEERRKTAKKVKIATAVFIPVFAVVLVFALWLYPDILKPSIAYQKAESLLESGETAYAAIAFGKIADYSDARERSFALWESFTPRQTISTDSNHLVGLTMDGSVLATGNNKYGQCDISEWSNVISISADSGQYTTGLKADGTVVAVGDNSYGQCNVSGWTDIVAVSAGGFHIVGLRADGTVVAVGDNSNGQCDVSNWKDIVAISAGSHYTVGLRVDGTVVATGTNSSGQCNVSPWVDIVAVFADQYHTIGLRSNGTVMATGNNDNRQCDVTFWENISAVAVGSFHTVGLQNDGTVVAIGDNSDGQCDVGNWKDVVAVAVGSFHTVGLQKDGTVVAVGDNNYGQCDVADWKDIVTISADIHHTVGLKADGTVVVSGYDDYGQCDVIGWTDIRAPQQTD